VTRYVQAVVVVGCCLLWWPAAARAATVRRLFEPTDMELEDPGVVELDMQFGVVRGQDAYRVSAPDFELDLGLTSNVEFDVDGEFAIAGPNTGAFSFDHVSPDNLWTSVKLGLLDFADVDADVAWTVGMQVGPEFPVANSAQGVGIEGLLLFGWRFHQTQLVLNLGGLVDPGGGGDAPRPSGPEYGIDLAQGLDAAGHWSLSGEISGVTYTSPDPDQFTTTVGITWSPSDNLDLSVVGLRGWLSGGDQYGVLFGVSPKFRLW